MWLRANWAIDSSTPLVQQVFVAFEPVPLNIVRTVEFERFAVGTVLLWQEIRADVVQQTANDHQMLVDEPRRNRYLRSALPWTAPRCM